MKATSPVPATAKSASHNLSAQLELRQHLSTTTNLDTDNSVILLHSNIWHCPDKL
ncbi:UNVERIFIED_CONTAM: hypothetical protein FKN15_078185 [Acipenser sinensis]